MDVASLKNKTKEADPIIDEAIEVYDALIAKVNAKDVENKKAHFNGVKDDLQKQSEALIEKVHKI